MHFYRTLARRELLQVQRELLKVAEDRSLTVREMYNEGQARRPQVRLADIALQRSRLDVMSAENEYSQRFRELTSVIGVDLNGGRVEGQLATTDQPMPFDAVLRRLWTESPQLAAARAKLVADQVTVRREEVQWIPNLTFSGGTGYDFENRSGVSMAGMQFNVPIFDRNQGTVRQAESDLTRQRNEVARVEWDLRMKLAEVYQRYLTAYQHLVEYQRVILPEARAAYRELLESYRANRVEWPDVLDAQHEYFDSQREYIQYLESFRVNEVLIFGFLLHDGLGAAPGPTPPGHIDSVPKPR
jgi:outer membrane protein, heavy metal efflux system